MYTHQVNPSAFENAVNDVNDAKVRIKFNYFTSNLFYYPLIAGNTYTHIQNKNKTKTYRQTGLATSSLNLAKTNT